MASFKKILDALKTAALAVKAKPGAPALKEALQTIQKSIDVPAIKRDVQALPITKTIEGILANIKAKAPKNLNFPKPPAIGTPAAPQKQVVPKFSATSTPVASEVSDAKKLLDEIAKRTPTKLEVTSPQKNPIEAMKSSSASPLNDVKKNVLNAVDSLKAKMTDLSNPANVESLKKAINLDGIKKTVQDAAAKATKKNEKK